MYQQKFGLETPLALIEVSRNSQSDTAFCFSTWVFYLLANSNVRPETQEEPFHGVFATSGRNRVADARMHSQMDAWTNEQLKRIAFVFHVFDFDLRSANHDDFCRLVFHHFEFSRQEIEHVRANKLVHNMPC